MDILRLYRDLGVEHYTEGQKHCRPGWVNTECPFCTGNKGYHLGWNIQDEYYVCWRCGWHPPVKTIMELTSLSFGDVRSLIAQYGINKSVLHYKEKEKQKIKYPSGTMELQKNHIVYLQTRGFSPEKLIKKWKLLGTGPISQLDGISYKHRIIIPFFWNGALVSFDSRDITGKHQNKYQACPKHYEVIEHKNILYGNQEKWNTELGICVEGPTDVWRLGNQSFAVSGIKYTQAQVRLIATIFKRVAVVFDDDPQAQVQAKKLVAELKFRGVDAFNVKIKGDPGSMRQKEVKELIQKIKKL